MEPLSKEELAAMEAGAKYGIRMLEEIPKNTPEEVEAHLTGVLCAFWGALWGTMGVEYARGFIESQLRSMEPGAHTHRFGQSNTH